jgi:hypothetical protein
MDVKVSVVVAGIYRSRRRNLNFQQQLRTYLEEQGDAVFFEIKDQFDNTLLNELDTLYAKYPSSSTYQIDRIELSNNPPYTFGIYGSIGIHLHDSFVQELTKHSALRTKVVSIFEDATETAKEVIDTYVLREQFLEADGYSLLLKLQVDKTAFQQLQNQVNRTKRNIQGRQTYRTITGLKNLGPGFSARRNLPENVARQIAEFSAGPLNNNFQRVRPLPEALKTETLKLPYETRLAKAEHARKPSLPKPSNNAYSKNTTRKNTAKRNTANQIPAKKPWWKLW